MTGFSSGTCTPRTSRPHRPRWTPPRSTPGGRPRWRSSSSGWPMAGPTWDCRCSTRYSIWMNHFGGARGWRSPLAGMGRSSWRPVMTPETRSRVLAALRRQHIETPSWALGNSGTRFKVFAQEGVPRTAHEKIDDAATVHRFTGVAPSVALHIPWDKVPDYAELAAHAA